MDPVSILGTTSSAIQIAELICKLGIRILGKRKDKKSLKKLLEDSTKYILYLERWEGEFEGEAKAACLQLRTLLGEIVDEIDAMETGNPVKKAFTAVQLKFHAPEYQSRVSEALREFQMRMCMVGSKSTKDADVTLEGITRRIGELQITAKTLDNFPAANDTIEQVHSEMERLSKTLCEMKNAISEVRQNV